MNDAKHILILSSWYPNEHQPFLGNFVVRQAQLLSRKYTVHLIHLESDSRVNSPQMWKSNEKGYEELIVRYPRGKGIISKFRNRKKALKEAFGQLEQVDLVIGNVLLPQGWQFVAAKEHFRAPLIYVEHGSYFRPQSPYKWRLRDKTNLRSVCLNANAIVAVSDVLASDMAPSFEGKKITVIGNHVDEELFTFREKEKVDDTRFLHISTLDKSLKNPGGIIEACRILKERNPDFSMTLVSDEDYSEWQSKATELGLEAHTSFHGPLEWHELPAFYHGADVFVLFSSYETFSIVLAEALSTGTPLITTKVGLAKHLSKDVAEFVEVGDVQGLASAMEECMKGRPFDYGKIREAGAAYHSARILSKWDAIITGIIATGSEDAAEPDHEN